MIACTQPRRVYHACAACPEPQTEPRSVAQHPHQPLASFPGQTPTCPVQTRGISHSPPPSLHPTDHCPLTTAHHSFKSFSCNTYESPRKCCKQKTYAPAKPFRCNTYKKPGVGGTAVALLMKNFKCMETPTDSKRLFSVQSTQRASVISRSVLTFLFTNSCHLPARHFPYFLISLRHYFNPTPEPRSAPVAADANSAWQYSSKCSRTASRYK